MRGGRARKSALCLSVAADGGLVRVKPPRRAQHGLARAGLVAFGLVLAVGLGEGIVRWLSPLQLGFEYADERFGPPREFDVDWQLNELGAHDYPPKLKPPGARRVLLLGDSFVQGLAVTIEETVGQRLALHLAGQSPGSFDVVSLSGAGASPDDELRLLARAGKELDPDEVISVLYPGNDVMQSLSGQARKRLLASGEILPPFHTLAHGFSREEALFFYFEGSRLNRLISQRISVAARKRGTSGIPIAFLVYSTDRDAPWASAREAAWARLEEALKETRAKAEALGAGYGVVSVASVYTVGGPGELESMIETYPDMRGFGWDLEEPGRRLAELCERNAIPFWSLLAGFRRAAQGSAEPLHWTFDRHWTPAGHDRAAQEIAAFIQAQGSKGVPGS